MFLDTHMPALNGFHTCPTPQRISHLPSPPPPPNANSELRWIFDFSENVFFVATCTGSVRALPPGYWRTTYSARSVGGPLLSALCMYRLSLYDSTTLPSWTSLRALLSSHSPEAPSAQRSVSLPVYCTASCHGLGVADAGMAVGRGQAVGWCGWCGWCGCGGGWCEWSEGGLWGHLECAHRVWCQTSGGGNPLASERAVAARRDSLLPRGGEARSNEFRRPNKRREGSANAPRACATSASTSANGLLCSDRAHARTVGAAMLAALAVAALDLRR